MKHPGKILLEDFMIPLGLTANQVAKALRVHRSTIGRLTAGQQRMTSEIAARLGAYFQVPAKWWLSMQTDYDAQQIEQHPELSDDVVPLQLDPALLLTPKGVLHLGEPKDTDAPPPSIPRGELEKLPQTSKPQPREVRIVHYAGGSVALVGEDYEQD